MPTITDIRAARIAARPKISQRELADRAGVTAPTVIRMEAGVKPSRPDIVERVQSALAEMIAERQP